MPKRRSTPINYNQISDILGLAMYKPAWRKKLLASPEKTLRAMGFEPHPEAVTFIKSLKTAGFDRAARKFKQPQGSLAKFSREG